MSNVTSTEMPPNVRAVFDAAPKDDRNGMLALRSRILETARDIDVGIDESLKWGQPSYRAPLGSPIRLGARKGGGFALYTHCATSLISDFLAIAPNAVADGNRAIHFLNTSDIEKIPIGALIRAALTYHEPQEPSSD